MRSPYSPPVSGRRRGLATVMAVVLIGLASVVFVALTSLTRQDLRRTASARAEAQLRQLLLAGESAALGSIDETGDHAAPLPATLAVDGATLNFRHEGQGDARSVTVDATFGGFRTSQVLTYERRDGRWRLVGAELSPTSAVAPVPIANER